MSVATLGDRVLEQTNGTGTGNLLLAGVPDVRFDTFAMGVGDQVRTFYTIVHRSTRQWEIGSGYVSVGTGANGADELVREQVIRNSMGTTSPINFIAGAKDVFADIPAEKLVMMDIDSSNVTLPADLTVGGALTAGASTLSSLYVSGSGSIDGTFTVIGAMTLGSTVSIGGFTYTFPDTQAANRYLKTDGGGNLTWASILETLALGDLSDVTIASAQTGQFLMKSAGDWVNHTFVTADISDLATAATGITQVGTIATGVWHGTAIADTYLATITTAGKVQNSATTATALNTVNAIVARDANGDFAAHAITGTSFVGALSKTLTFGTHLTGTSFNNSADVTIATDATPTSVANTIVARDISGNFSAGHISADITGNLVGNADTASKLFTPRAIWGQSFDGTADVSGALTGVSTIVTSGAITAGGGVLGNLTGNVTGNVSGNAGTVTNGVYTTGSYADPSWITSLAGAKITGNIGGNAGTATALQTPRTIWGQSFDGTADVTGAFSGTSGVFSSFLRADTLTAQSSVGTTVVLNTTTGAVSDVAYISYQRGGVVKWYAGNNANGTNVDDFSIASAASGPSAPILRITQAGAIALSSTVTASGDFTRDGAAGTVRSYILTTAGVSRWKINASSGAESGANAGTNFQIQAFDDSGVSLGNAMSITRSNQAVVFIGTVTSNSNIVAQNGMSVSGGNFSVLTGTSSLGGATTISSTLGVTGTITTNGVLISQRGSGGQLRIYSDTTAGSHQWDIFTNGTDLQLSDNTGGGTFKTPSLTVTGAATFQNTLGVTGAATFSSYVDAVSYRLSGSVGMDISSAHVRLAAGYNGVIIPNAFVQTGTVAARFENTFVSRPTTAAGVGVELGVSGGVASVGSYNATSAAQAPLQLVGSSVTIAPATTLQSSLTVATTGQFGAFAAAPTAIGTRQNVLVVSPDINDGQTRSGTIAIATYGTTNPDYLSIVHGGFPNAPATVGLTQTLWRGIYAGYDGAAYHRAPWVSVSATEAWTATANGSKITFSTTANTTTTNNTVLTLDQDKSATFTGTVSAATTSGFKLGTASVLKSDGSTVAIYPLASGNNVQINNFADTAANLQITDVGNLTIRGTITSTGGRVALGGTSASFPAINANGTTLEVILADNSNYAPFKSSTITTTSNIVSGKGVYATGLSEPPGAGPMVGMGYLSGAAYVYSYDFTAAAYKPMNINASSIVFQNCGITVTTGASTFNGAVNVTPASGSAIALNVTAAVGGNYAAQIVNSRTASNAFGLYVQGGTASTDYALRVTSAASSGATELFSIRGDGLTSLLGKVTVGTVNASDLAAMPAGSIMINQNSYLMSASGGGGYKILIGYDTTGSVLIDNQQIGTTISNATRIGVLGGYGYVSVGNSNASGANAPTSLATVTGMFGFAGDTNTYLNARTGGAVSLRVNNTPVLDVAASGVTLTHATGATLVLNTTSGAVTDIAYTVFERGGTIKAFAGLNAGNTNADIYTIGTASAGLAFNIRQNGAIFTQTATSASNYAATFQQMNTTASSSFGLQVQGGTNASDIALNVLNAAGSTTLFRVTGDGAASVGSSLTVTGSVTTGIVVGSASTAARVDVTNGTDTVRVGSSNIFTATNTDFAIGAAGANRAWISWATGALLVGTQTNSSSTIGDIVVKNGQGLRSVNGANTTTIPLVYLDASNVIQIASANNNVTLGTGQATLGGNLRQTAGHHYLANGYTLSIKDTGGTDRQMIGFGGGNILELGYSGIAGVYLYGSAIGFPSGTQIYSSTGGISITPAGSLVLQPSGSSSDIYVRAGGSGGIVYIGDTATSYVNIGAGGSVETRITKSAWIGVSGGTLAVGGGSGPNTNINLDVVNATVTASGGGATGIYDRPGLVAVANNDIFYGMYVTPTVVKGTGLTGLSYAGVRIGGSTSGTSTMNINYGLLIDPMPSASTKYAIYVNSSDLLNFGTGAATFGGNLTFKTQTNSIVTVTYSTSMTVDASAGTVFHINITDANAFTMNAPSNPTTGQTIYIIFTNSTAGAAGTITWDATFRTSTLTAPAAGKKRVYTYFYDGSNWLAWNRENADL